MNSPAGSRQRRFAHRPSSYPLCQISTSPLLSSLIFTIGKFGKGNRQEKQARPVKELTIHHLPARGRGRPRVRVSYRPQEGAQAQERETPFKFAVTDEQRHQVAEAERWYRQSLAIAERIGNEHGQASTLHQLGMIAEKQGKTAEAVQFYERAEALLVRLDDPHNLGIVHASLQRVRGGTGN
jgi:tetratricopeptide (TPR) repeat protein